MVTAATPEPASRWPRVVEGARSPAQRAGCHARKHRLALALRLDCGPATQMRRSPGARVLPAPHAAGLRTATRCEVALTSSSSDLRVARLRTARG